MNMDDMPMNDDGTMGGMSPTTSGNDSMRVMSPTTPTKDSMGGMDMGMDMSMTHMTFYWGKDAWILFEGWPGNNTTMYILALVFVFFLALILEFLAHSHITPSKSNRILRTMIHTFRVVFSYLVMLAVMSFNIGVFVMAIAGHVVGFYVFRVLNNSSDKDSDMSSMAC
ncbi:hypothetical protein QVD17_17528 [Tagetes erecta]|uniref:Copper transport protein n=1 Tax=Tagetes erecta TaxID=13708 RepID=A0AAD8P1I2_TARER|nr:hypothetical protein QVD17_17528 [Tagetes erecta]